MTARKFNIATGKSRFERVWTNVAWTWDELRAKLMEPVVTSETMSDYRRMTREEQTRVKDIGGFVGGYLTKGRRNAQSVATRSLVTLDYDEFDASHLEEMRAELPQRWLLHSTHKHRDDAWRVRIVIPADRNMTPDEYGAVARRLAERIGFTGIDRTTFEPCRLMFWPSRSSDGPWLFEESQGELLSVDEVLGTYTDWRDMSEWPLLPDEESVMLFTGAKPGQLHAPSAMRDTGRYGKQEDPLGKRGVIGAFCRTYDVPAAISRFLPHLYTRERENRYTHVGGSSSCGVWVIDGGRFFYSFHSTDPLQGRLLNAWDMVRLALYGAEDAGKGEDTRVDRLPSSRLMTEMAMKDPGVKLTMREERKREAAADYAGYDLSAELPYWGPGHSGAGAPEHGRETAHAAGSAEKSADQREWDEVYVTLRQNKDGSLVSTTTNIMAVLEHEPRMKGRMRLNDFSGDVTVFGNLPWRRANKTWTNTDEANLRCWLDREFGITGKEKISDAVKAVTNSHGFHPIKDYLLALTWDGKPRLHTIFINVLGAEDTAVNRELPRLFFKAACRRIFHPGEKFDYFPILYGPEGCGKSSVFAIMGGEWFNDSVKTIEGKEGMESIQGSWIVEIGELIGVKRSAVESVKSFISSQYDRYRPAYGTVTETRPRQCIMVGTTNEEFFLRGLDAKNRRQPVVEIKPELRTVCEDVRTWMFEWRDQLWAEAMELHKEGGALILPSDLDREIRRVQDEHNLDKCNPLFPEVERFLNFHLPSDWERMSLLERQKWVETGPGANDPEGGGMFSALRQTVTVPEILQELFMMKKTDKDYLSKSREIGAFLKTLSPQWEMIGNQRNKLYGVQKTWKRNVTECNRTLGNTLEDL